MPIKKCKSRGKTGYQWGNQKCYTGKNAKKRAIRQMRAIYAMGYKDKK